MGTIITLERAGGRGRQPAEVEALRDARDELAALTAEGLEFALRITTLARQAQVALARGWSPAQALDELERLGTRHANRLTSAEVEVTPLCPDGETVRHLGHGRAA
jgi:hypothetical protein